ncbi:MAG TPA: serine/threonine-protein kinase [Nannocystaceae bacterium]|nr:serine/threonine-protein kinase [Nannocystaceae bacterium]
MNDGLESLRSDSGTREADLATIASVDGRPESGPQEELAPGAIVAGNFRIVRTIGRGAMGVVYEAIDTMLERRVAVKLRGLDRAHEDASRMWREAKTMARLSHPNVVTVYEVALHEGALCIAMELVEGSDARAWAKQRSRSTAEILDIYVQACRGLAAAHRLGIVHRDFKPDNVLVGDDGRVRVADFGIARLHDVPDTEAQSEVDHSGSVEPVRTKTGALMGTPAYMAPEQVVGATASAAADQFACCATIYEALYDALPFTSESIAARFVAIQEQRFAPHEHTRDVPNHIAAALRRGLACDPDARWPSIDALAAALAADPTRRRRRIALGIGVLGVAALGAWAVREPAVDRCAGLRASATEVWTAAREGELATQFGNAGSPIAEAAAANVHARVAPWADTWAAAREDACRATWDRGEQSSERFDERMDCLARQRADTDGVLAVLATADAEAIARLDELLTRLPDPTRCSAPDALHGDRVAPPDRELYERSYAVIAEAEAEHAAGRSQRAADRLDDELATLRGAGWRWLEARAQLLRGRALSEIGFDAESRAALEQALVAAFATSDDELQMHAMATLARQLGARTRWTTEAIHWLDAADAIAARIAASPDTRIELARYRAEVLRAAHRFAEAEAIARPLLDQYPAEGLQDAGVLRDLAMTMCEERRPAEALELLARARAIAERDLGTDAPVLLAIMDAEHRAFRDLRRGKDALAVADRALEFATRLFGADAPTTGAYRRLRADALSALARYAEASAEFERALAIARANHDDADTIFALVNAAAVQDLLGDQPRALAMVQEAVALTDEYFGSDSLRAAQLRVSLSGYLIANDRYPEARVAAHQAVLLYERNVGPMDPGLVAPLANYAILLAHDHEGDAAVDSLDRGARVLEAAGVADPDAWSNYFGTRLSVMRVLERWPEAIAAAEQMVRFSETGHAEPHPAQVDALYHLGEALISGGRAAQARAPAERALALLDEVEARPRRRATLEWILARALSTDRTQRQRALAYARSAAARFAELDDVETADVKAWIAERQ